MEKAKFATSNSTKIISARDIKSRKEYMEKYVGKLFCAEAGCNAMLDYVELSNYRREKIFRTHKHSNHSPDCPFQIIRTEGKGPTFSSTTFSKAISDEHIKSILKGLRQRNSGEASGTSQQTKSKVVSKLNKTKERDSLKGRAVASIDADAEPVKRGEREPTVKKRRGIDLLPEDDSRLRGIDGYIDAAYIGEKFVELHFSNTTTKTTLLFYNAFRDKSDRAYKFVKDIADEVNSSDLKIFICCVGVVEFLADKIQIQIMNPSYITFEGLSIYNYMRIKAM